MGVNTCLSLTAIFSVIGIALIIIAVGTYDWNNYSVNRREIVNAFNREPELSIKLKDAFLKDSLYFSRSYGLLHTCFSDAVPSDIGSFQFLGSPCVWNNDYLPSEAKQASMSNDAIYRMWWMRASILLYAIGIAVAVFALMIGVLGCWRRSSGFVLTTAVLMLFAVLILGGAMASWHYTQYMERWTLDEAPFFKSWESILKSTSRQHYGWSYISSWSGIIFLLLAAIFMFIAKHYLKKDEEKAFEAKHEAYMMPSYYDKGAVMPYYNTYTAGAYGGYPPAPYGTYGGYPNAYYGYMTYGR